MSPFKKALNKLDHIIDIARTDLYKPIQIAEVLYRSRVNQDIVIHNIETYRNESKKWRDIITRRLLGKVCTSSARFQDNLWESNAMPPSSLKILDKYNRKFDGAIECYIYYRFITRQELIADIIEQIDQASADTFELKVVLNLFTEKTALRRSIDKVYEIITYGLFETIVSHLEAQVTISIAQRNHDLLREFSDLAEILLGLFPDSLETTLPAHIYRVGVTNAADRGLDMWANFGPAIQVKHLTLKSQLANKIIDQVESDYIVIVCKDAEADVIETVLKQISWGQRVRGIVKESDLILWYEKCLRGQFSERLSCALLETLRLGFKAEFPHAAEVIKLCQERDYNKSKLEILHREG